MAETIPQIVRGFRQISREISIHSKFIQDTCNITVPQLICLHEIHDHGSMTLGALTRALYLSNSTITGIVDRLENRGMVRRVRKEGDRRRIHVEITTEGEDFIQRAPQLLQAHFIEEIQSMDPREVENLLWAINKLAGMLQSARKIEIEQPRMSQKKDTVPSSESK